MLALGAAARQLWMSGGTGWTEAMFAVVFGALLAASWLWPIMLYLDERSNAFDLDEGFFVLLVLLVPAALTVVVFAAAAVAVHVLRRRSVLASAFDVARVTTAAGVSSAVFVALDGAADPTGYLRVGAALVGGITYLVVNVAATLSLARASGTPWRQTLLNGIEGKLLVAGASIDIAIPTALLLSKEPKFLPLAVLPLLALRYLGEGHFYARNDRLRLRGLFEATLDINRTMGSEATQSAVLTSARSLLRSPEVSLADQRPERGDGTLAAPVELADRRLWLSVSGRSRAEPFEDEDRALLHALASVGAVALANTELYAEVERQKDRLSVITSSLGEGVCAVSKDGRITFMNPAGSAMLGWPAASNDRVPYAPVQTPRFLLDPAMRAMSLRQNVVSDDTRFERTDGTRFPVTMTASPVVGDSTPSAAVIVFRDTSERKAFEEQLARHAFQDALTGLANRRLLLDHLDHALLQAERGDERVAVLFGDVDRFKVVNDNLGHQTGDELLRIVAERLRRAVRPGDTLSRFGGDEFVVILEGIESSEEASGVADRLLQCLREPIVLSGGREVVTTMSIGLAISEPGTSRDDLLHDADVAMYRAKERGRGGQVTLFDVDRMGGRSAGRLDLDAALHHAVERDEIEVYYQPLMSLADRRIVGAEALVRWDHPEHGILAPEQFIELAEDNGTILSIGHTVFERACRQAVEWRETFGAWLKVYVNLSARQFAQVDLAEHVAAVLRSTGIDPAQLCLEITESLAMDDVDTTRAVLGKLHGLGISLAIDDFGTGHSSLGYLSRFPVDVIKIDQSFVRDIDRDPVKSAIVCAVVGLSDAIGSETVVEGVETQAELEQLEGLGCHAAQGFYFSRPLPATSFTDLLASTVRPPSDLGRLREAIAG